MRLGATIFALAAVALFVPALAIQAPALNRGKLRSAGMRFQKDDGVIYSDDKTYLEYENYETDFDNCALKKDDGLAYNTDKTYLEYEDTDKSGCVLKNEAMIMSLAMAKQPGGRTTAPQNNAQRTADRCKSVCKSVLYLDWQDRVKMKTNFVGCVSKGTDATDVDFCAKECRSNAEERAMKCKKLCKSVFYADADGREEEGQPQSFGCISNENAPLQPEFCANRCSAHLAEYECKDDKCCKDQESEQMSRNLVDDCQISPGVCYTNVNPDDPTDPTTNAPFMIKDGKGIVCGTLNLNDIDGKGTACTCCIDSCIPLFDTSTIGSGGSEGSESEAPQTLDDMSSSLASPAPAGVCVLTPDGLSRMGQNDGMEERFGTCCQACEVSSTNVCTGTGEGVAPCQTSQMSLYCDNNCHVVPQQPDADAAVDPLDAAFEAQYKEGDDEKVYSGDPYDDF